MFNIENVHDKQMVVGYILVVLLSTWIFIFLIFQDPVVGLSFFAVIMFFPAIAAVIFGILQGKSFRSMFACVVARPSLKSMVFGVGYPIVFVGTCGIIALLTGLGHFNPGTSTLVYIIISCIILILVNLITVFGEEYGWRGYLLPKLTRITGKTRATIIVGIVWALFHFPAVYFLSKTTGIGDPLLIATLQAVSVFLISFAFSYSYYLARGSLVPVLFLHSTWNVVNVLILGDIYTNHHGIISGNIPIINGEGLFGVILSGILVIWFIKKFKKSDMHTNTL